MAIKSKKPEIEQQKQIDPSTWLEAFAEGRGGAITASAHRTYGDLMEHSDSPYSVPLPPDFLGAIVYLLESDVKPLVMQLRERPYQQMETAISNLLTVHSQFLHWKLVADLVGLQQQPQLVGGAIAYAIFVINNFVGRVISARDQGTFEKDFAEYEGVTADELMISMTKVLMALYSAKPVAAATAANDTAEVVKDDIRPVAANMAPAKGLN